MSRHAAAWSFKPAERIVAVREVDMLARLFSLSP
jgi:hypothetical protein